MREFLSVQLRRMAGVAVVSAPLLSFVLAAVPQASQTAKPASIPPDCPNLTYKYESRVNTSVVNATLSLINNGPGTTAGVTVTEITCNNGFAYAPQNSKLGLPFAIPGAANLRQGDSVKFNAFFQKGANPQTDSFTCTLRYTEGKSCKGTGAVTVPSRLGASRAEHRWLGIFSLRRISSK
jgi:hypothetical protein